MEIVKESKDTLDIQEIVHKNIKEMTADERIFYDKYVKDNTELPLPKKRGRPKVSVKLGKDTEEEHLNELPLPPPPPKDKNFCSDCKIKLSSFGNKTEYQTGFKCKECNKIYRRGLNK